MTNKDGNMLLTVELLEMLLRKKLINQPTYSCVKRMLQQELKEVA